PDVAFRADPGALVLYGLVFRRRSGRHDWSDRLAHRGVGEARVLRRARGAGDRGSAGSRDRAAGDRAGEPRRDRARLAVDDLRAHSADLRPGHVLRLARTRDRHLHLAYCISPRDRRRTAASRRRAVTTPSTAPPTTSNG